MERHCYTIFTPCGAVGKSVLFAVPMLFPSLLHCLKGGVWMPPPSHPRFEQVHSMKSTDLEACMHCSRAHRPPRLSERGGNGTKYSPAAGEGESPTASSSTPSKGAIFLIIVRLSGNG